jgi:dephospho-CoA kinase
MRAIICLGGEIASGKTTVAAALANHFPGAVVRSFGDVVRKEARSQGRPLDRATLQEVGISLIALGWESFVGVLLADLPDTTDVLIIEGIRHREAISEIARRNLGGQFLSVYLAIDLYIQQERLQARGEPLTDKAHEIESSLAEVQAAADLVLNGGLPVPETVAAIVARLA